MATSVSHTLPSLSVDKPCGIENLQRATSNERRSSATAGEQVSRAIAPLLDDVTRVRVDQQDGVLVDGAELVRVEMNAVGERPANGNERVPSDFVPRSTHSAVHSLEPRWNTNSSFEFCALPARPLTCPNCNTCCESSSFETMLSAGRASTACSADI
jgi:hypothetical protein